MNIARFAVTRPVTILMGILATLVLGAMAFTHLKIDLFPDITFPVIAVVTHYPGVSPEEVESFVTQPIEEAAAVVEDLKSLRSISRESLSVVIIEFEWGHDMDAAAFDTREKVDPVIERLPEDVHRPLIIKMDPATMSPVILVDVMGIKDQRRLREIADDLVKPQLEKLPGVASATLFGGLQREIMVEVDRARLEAYGLSVQQIEAALERENVNIPGGHTTEGPKEFTIRTVGEFQTVDEIPGIAVGMSGGAVVRLRDVAEVKDTHREIRSYARLNGEPCVSLAIMKETVANTTEVCEAVREAIKTIPDRLPPGITLTATYDQSDFIGDSIHNLEAVAVEGGILAVVIIFLFLATLRGTLVTAISIPLSLIATFVLMFSQNMTLNIITMGGLVLAIGRIVDDSVVVLENIHRHMSEGESPFKAAVSGTREVAMAITAATLTTMCVFAPLLFVGGLVSELFTPMALVVMFGLFASLVVALTVIPMMSSRVLHPDEHNSNSGGSSNGPLGFVASLLRRWAQGFDRLRELYVRTVDWCLSHRALVTATALGVFIFSVMLVPLVGQEFFPDMDRGELSITMETPVGSSVEHTNEKAKQVEALLLGLSEAKNVEASVGESEGGSIMMMRGGTASGARTASFYVTLVDRRERERTTDQVEEWLRDQFAKIPGITTRFEATMGRPGAVPIEITLTGDDLDELGRLANEAKEKLSEVPGMVDLRLDWEEGVPEYQVILDREKAGTFGITAGHVAATLRTLVKGSDELTKFRERGEEYDITVRAREADREWFQQLEEVTIAAPTGQLVPLVQIAEIRPALGPTQISRDERRRAVNIQGDKTGRSLDAIVEDVDAAMATLNWPEGYFYEFGGDEEDRRESFAGMGLALILGILLIYIILASQFESLVHPFTIMLAIPLEVIGVFAALLLTHTTISIMVFLGILMLTGIVVSNSILLVNIINILRDEGMETREAIIQGGAVRLRPILMTAIATVFAMLPMALAFREGSEMWKPLATAVLGGLLSSTFLTLLVVPVAYSVFDQIGERLGLGRKHIEIEE